MADALSIRLTLALVIMLIIGEALAPALQPNHAAVYGFWHLAQIILLVMLACTIKREMRRCHAPAPPLSPHDWSRVTTLLVSGMVFSLAGDVMNSGLVDLTALLQPQTLLSVPPFALAHCCYITAFYLLSRHTLPHTSNLYLSVMIAAVPVLAIGLWSLVMPPAAPRFVANASLLYAFMVAGTVMAAILLVRAWRGEGVPVLAGAVLFLISDALLGYFLMRERPFFMGQIIWATYVLGQLLILRAGLLFRASPA